MEVASYLFDFLELSKNLAGTIHFDLMIGVLVLVDTV